MAELLFEWESDVKLGHQNESWTSGLSSLYSESPILTEVTPDVLFYYSSSSCACGATWHLPRGKHVGCAEQVLTEKTMKKLCFSLVWHEKVMNFGGYSSLRGRVSTPACSPGPGTSFLMFLKLLKILIFLSRLFHHGFLKMYQKFD